LPVRFRAWFRRRGESHLNFRSLFQRISLSLRNFSIARGGNAATTFAFATISIIVALPIIDPGRDGHSQFN
jgi:hypothetical protein